ncbi:30S ribosomal protein S6 [Candidatus Daviesbacteria bacterium RIFOXYD1_FULL_41_10]|uniref:Small ribosomal subunit protein bS6 n=2 Tax=Candidatus Daviesiibacteriota TaxID=1752718 RepID=A0A1F5N1M2_9BACT|nr:MAG: 30S ribosomal protein S6 [Candidatus Daviesbacteria bacterium GW2011_GWB1_41_5]OGE71515.1 MAG: 30S ribosomal protein S6 [Candidatus Daviesbacteria bacterium RIFOXYD1_FULL_41_10]
MNKYVLTLILKPDLDEKARKELLSSVVKRFGKLEKEEMWGAKDMVYPIKHQTKGFYAHYTFEAEPSSISSLDKDLKIDEDILRYLLVRVK